MGEGRERNQKISPLPSPIYPLILGADDKAIAAAQKLQAQGYDVRAIRPPTVPEGTARLRVSINIGTTKEQLNALANAIQTAAFQ